MSNTEKPFQSLITETLADESNVAWDWVSKIEKSKPNIREEAMKSATAALFGFIRKTNPDVVPSFNMVLALKEKYDPQKALRLERLILAYYKLPENSAEGKKVWAEINSLVKEINAWANSEK